MNLKSGNILASPEKMGGSQVECTVVIEYRTFGREYIKLSK